MSDLIGRTLARQITDTVRGESIIRLPDQTLPETRIDPIDNMEVALIPKANLVRWNANRRLTDSHVRMLRNTWKDRRASVLEVRPHPSRPNVFEVIIGNHRFTAADGLSWVTRMWCKIHYGMSDEEASELWRSEAKDRKNPTATDLFHNAVHSKDPAALAVQALIHGAGRGASDTKNSTTTNVACLGTLMSLYRKDREVLTRIFPLLGALCQGHVFQEMIVRGLFALESRLMNGSLAHTSWYERAMSIGYTRIVAAMNKRNINRGGHNEKQWADALLVELNFNKQRRNHLIGRGLNDDAAD